MRAPVSGILHMTSHLGGKVAKGSRIGFIADPFGEKEDDIRSPVSGIVIGRLNLPLAHEGDHIAAFDEDVFRKLYEFPEPEPLERASPADQGGRHRVLQVRFLRHLDLLTLHDGIDIGQLVEIVDEGGQLDPGRRADTGLQGAGQEFGDIAEFLQGPVTEFPGPGRRECHGIVGRIELEQQIGSETKERDQALVDAVGIGPGHPVVEVGIDLKVGEAIGQGGWHGVSDAAVALAIAGGENGPVVRHLVLTESAVEDQLIGRRRHRWRCRCDLIQEQDALGAVPDGIRQQGGNGPLDPVVGAKGNSAQVAGFHLRQTDVDDRHRMRSGDLGYHLGFAHTGRSPQHDRRVVTFMGTGEFAVQDDQQLGGTHYNSKVAWRFHHTCKPYDC